MRTTIKYLIAPDAITFKTENDVKTVTREQEYLYETLKGLLLGEGDKQELELIRAIDSPKEFFLECLRSRRGFHGIQERVEQLQADNVPIEPFLSFASGLSPSFIERFPNFISVVGTKELPLTWDGNLIAYQRASWINRDYSEGKFWADANLKPLQTVERPQTVSGFTWAQTACPDTGLTYEVIVQPEHLISLDNQTLQVSQITMLSCLGEYVRDESRSETPIVEIQTQCSELGNNAIRLPYNVETASHLLNSVFEENTSFSSVNNVTNPIAPDSTSGC